MVVFIGAEMAAPEQPCANKRNGRIRDWRIQFSRLGPEALEPRPILRAGGETTARLIAYPRLT
jgi:hypothetical protein